MALPNTGAPGRSKERSRQVRSDQVSRPTHSDGNGRVHCGQTPQFSHAGDDRRARMAASNGVATDGSTSLVILTTIKPWGRRLGTQLRSMLELPAIAGFSATR